MSTVKYFTIQREQFETLIQLFVKNRGFTELCSLDRAFIEIFKQF